MSNTTTIHARIDCTLKENVENILSQLGLTSSDAIKLFYKQIELHGGLPFDLKLPDKVLVEKDLLKKLIKGEKSGEE